MWGGGGLLEVLQVLGWSGGAWGSGGSFWLLWLDTVSRRVMVTWRNIVHLDFL